MAIPFLDCFRFLVEQRKDELVISSAGNTSAVWWELTEDFDRTFYLEASMSMLSMFVGGMAQGLPQAKFWAITGDGAFAMNPGMLMVERQMALPNVVHFLASNRVYGATSEAPLPNRTHTDYGAVARGFGIERVYTFTSLDDLRQQFVEVVGGTGPTFVVLELEPLGRPTREVPVEGPELKYRFGRSIERTYGVTVFER